MRNQTVLQELTLEVKGRKVTLPVLWVSLWEETDEEGYVVDEGYIYHTTFGKVITRLTDEGEEVVHLNLGKAGGLESA